MTHSPIHFKKLKDFLMNLKKEKNLSLIGINFKEQPGLVF